MRWRLVPLVLCSFSFGGPAIAFELYGPTGLALGAHSTTVVGDGYVLSNPALLSRGRARGEILFQFPGRETQRSLDSEFRSPYSEFLVTRDTLASSPTAENAQSALDSASKLFGKQDANLESYSVTIAFPTLPIAIGAYFRGTHLETRRVDSQGAADMSDISNPNFNAILSTKSLTVLDAGTVFSRSFGMDDGGSTFFSVGVRPKLLVFQKGYRDLELSDIHLDTQPLQKSNDGWLNIDVGAVGTYMYRWRWGLLVNDLLSRKTSYLNGDTLHSHPQVTAALSYSISDWVLVGGGELSRGNQWTGENSSQLISIGVENRINNIFIPRISLSYDVLSECHQIGIGVTLDGEDVVLEMGYALSQSIEAFTANITLGF